MIDELRDLANIRIAAHQQRITRAYNKNTRIRRIHVRDLVLRKTFQNTKDHSAGKVSPQWEGPYLIDVEAGKGAYWLATLDGDVLQRSWNALHIKAYFS